MSPGKISMLIFVFILQLSCKNSLQSGQKADQQERLEVVQDSIKLIDNTNDFDSIKSSSSDTKLGDNRSQTEVVTHSNDVTSKDQTSNLSDSKAQIPKPAIPPAKTVSMTNEQKQKQSDKVNTPPDPKPEKIKPANHEIYHNLLQKYVNKEGKVNYAGLKKDMTTLEGYAYSLSDDPSFTRGSQKEKLALWINTYNVYTLLMVTQNYPLSSIRDLHAGKPWDASWIRIGKKTYSLNQIENDIIRPQFDEPRIHFVLNCAARSCPPLVNKAITSANLETILESATQNFINGKENKIQENAVEISSIFDWYRQDFGDVILFLSKYSGVKIKPNAKITYKKYDWALNGS